MMISHRIVVSTSVSLIWFFWLYVWYEILFWKPLGIIIIKITVRFLAIVLFYGCVQSNCTIAQEDDHQPPQEAHSNYTQLVKDEVDIFYS